MMTAYWWRGVPNFGDALAPLLLERFAGIPTEWSPVASASIVSIGSILEHIPAGWKGFILGSGRLKEHSFLNVSGATILALRGPLSARGIPGQYVLGDPGLLADELVGAQDKQWDLGILPHWRDKELVPRFQAMFDGLPATLKIIDPGDEPLEVVRQIGACHRMVTSSLHGMIVSDAFNIPRRVERSAALDREGGDFKFRDYSASIQTPFEPGKMTEPNRWAVEDVRFAIHDAFKILERHHDEMLQA